MQSIRIFLPRNVLVAVTRPRLQKFRKRGGKHIGNFVGVGRKGCLRGDGGHNWGDGEKVLAEDGGEGRDDVDGARINSKFFVGFSKCGGDIIFVLFFSLAPWETYFAGVRSHLAGSLRENDVNFAVGGGFEERDQDGGMTR